MLEAPEAKLAALQLRQYLTGKTITEVEILSSPHKFAWFNGDPDAYRDKLIGKTVTDSRSWGGLVELEAGDMNLIFGDGVNFSFIAPGGDLPAKHQLLLGFDDESCLTASVRMYGGIWCVKDGEEFGFQPYYDSARQKPQLMSDAFTRGYFMSLFDAPAVPKKSAKAFLATQQNIPGLGNGVLQDILFESGINPKTKVADISEAGRGRMYDSIIMVTRRIFESGGRDCESDIFGRRGSYRPYLSASTAGGDCPRCGSLIVKENYLGGSIYYCSGCQPYKK